MEWIAKPFFEMPPRCPPVEEFYLTSPVWDEHMWDGPHDVEEGLHIRLSCLRRIHLSQADAGYTWEELMLSRIAIPAGCSNPMELLYCDEFETTSPTNHLPPAADSSPLRGIDSISLQFSKQHRTSGLYVHSRTLLVIPYATLNARGLRLAKKAGSCSYLVVLVNGNLPVRHWKDMLSILPSSARIDIVQLDNTRNGFDHACDVLCPEPLSRGLGPKLRTIYWHTTGEI